MTRFTLAAALLAASALSAQTPAHDPSDRLREVLPAPVAQRVLARIAAARAHQLPARALEQRALMLASRGVAPDDIERAVERHAEHLEQAEHALAQARGHRPGDDEVEAGAEAIGHGVDGSAVSALARSAPSRRSLTVPLYVIGSLASRGLPSDQALARVLARLKARASDRDLEDLPEQAEPDARPHGNKTHGHGSDVRLAHRVEPSHGQGVHGGPPAGVPANHGHSGHSGHPAHPEHPDHPTHPAHP